MLASGLFDLAQPLFRIMGAETAHTTALGALRVLHSLGLAGTQRSDDTPIECFGLTFPNRLGLAAGCDKNGDYLDALGALGFGFVEIGTVTPRPQAGNSRPRLFRVPSELAVINRMGFNNKGVDHLVGNLRTRTYTGVCGVNIGKNADTPNDRAQEDYLECFRKVFPCADYVTLNVSSPNTPGLRDLQTREGLEQVAGPVLDERKRLCTQHGRNVPVLIKLAPDLQSKELQDIIETATSLGVDGIIATNTTTDLASVLHAVPPGASGGLSGQPLFDHAIKSVREMRRGARCQVPVIGVGGITTGQRAVEMLQAGAGLVQIYSGFVFHGPDLVTEILKAIRIADTMDGVVP